MKLNAKSLLTSLAGVTLLAAISTQAATFGYDNLSTTVVAGYSEPNANNPTYGDQLNLTRSGVMSIFGCSLFNSSSGGNTGAITNGTMTVKFYDNTTPYAGSGPITGTLLGTATLTWTFATGLPAGFYSTGTFDLTSLNINLSQNILVTQQFTETVGTSTRNGVVLGGDPVWGTSPNNVYIKSTATAEGLYVFSGAAANSQFLYQIQLVPEPSTFALAGLGIAALLISRRRK